MRILIKDGRVITATEDAPADVLIDGERIAAITAPGAHDWEGGGVDRTIDAGRKYVIPGGIDCHTHMELPFGGTVASDSFETGTRAAAWGGTTTIVDFAVQVKGESIMEGFERWMAKAEGNCAIDYGFHMIVGDVNERSLAEMDEILDEGVTSFKLFMAYPGVLYSDDGEIFRAMQKAAGNGSTIMMHAENGIAIDVLRSQAIERGETDPKYHSITRPSLTEVEATYRAIALARLAGCPLYIVHMSAADAVEEVTRARDRGQNVFGETCPQYLFLSLEEHLSRGWEGSKYVCSTPVRARAEGHQEGLWRALARNDLQIVSTDHCPFFFDEDETLGKQKELGMGDFTKIPNGLPGVEERLMLVYQGGVVEGRFGLNRWIDICATAPAKMFGLCPRKGTIAVGSDADVVVFDPTVSQTLSADRIHMNVDYTCYEGQRIDGRVDTVLSRGRVIIENDEYRGSKGHGRYVKRDFSQNLM